MELAKYKACICEGWELTVCLVVPTFPLLQEIPLPLPAILSAN